MTLGAVLWSGPSELDGKPIVAIATGLNGKGTMANSKTGDVVQLWIIRSDVDPHLAVGSGADESVCGDCKLRRDPIDGSRGCYVNIGHVRMIYKAYVAGVYRSLPEVDWSKYFAARKVRLGAYGDPAAIPILVWYAIVEHARGWFGYTHAWKTGGPRMRELVMASCDTDDEVADARALGWRTFRTRLPNEPLIAGEISCPASAEMNKRSNCARCSLCDGSHGQEDRRKNISIIAHGWSASVFGYKQARARLEVLR